MTTQNFYDKNLLFSSHPMLTVSWGKQFTYSAIYELEDQMMTLLPPRSLIFILCRNNYACVAGYLGALRYRHVALLLDARISDEQLRDLCHRYHPNVLLMPKDRPNFERFTFDAEQYKEGKSTVLWENEDYALRSHTSAPPEMNASLALLLSSSGSTGSPKLIRLSSRNLQENALSISQYLQLTPRERPVTSLPMHYTYGLSVINSHLLAGANILLTELPLFSADFWDFVKSEKATSFSGVPYTYQILYKLNMDSLHIPSLKTMTQAGGKLPAELQEYFGEYCRKHKMHFFIMYGQTEATARISYLPPEQCLRKIGSIGHAIPGGKLEIRDKNHHVITKPMTTGELVYSGPNVSLGYALTAADLMTGDRNHGILETGDLAQFDDEGYFYIVGRLNRFIKIAGKRLSLDDVEALLAKKWPAFQFICSGKDDALRIYPVAEASAQDVPAKSQICTYLEACLHMNHTAFQVHFLPEIPRNAAGKILYSALPD